MDAPWRVAQPAQDDDTSTQYEAVAAWIREQPEPVTTAEVSAQFPTAGNVAAAVSRAHAEGLVQRVSRGVYAAPSPAWVGDEVAGLSHSPELEPQPLGLREWLQAGVDNGHLTEAAAAVVYWRGGM